MDYKMGVAHFKLLFVTKTFESSCNALWVYFDSKTFHQTWTTEDCFFQSNNIIGGMFLMENSLSNTQIEAVVVIGGKTIRILYKKEWNKTCPLINAKHIQCNNKNMIPVVYLQLTEDENACGGCTKRFFFFINFVNMYNSKPFYSNTNKPTMVYYKLLLDITILFHQKLINDPYLLTDSPSFT